MSRSFKLIVTLCLFISAARCQNKIQPHPFVMTIQGGIMEGQTDKTVPQFQLLGGIKKDTWLLSLGAGMDYYGARSIPLFLDVKNIFGKKSNSFFGYGALGYNFSWLRDNEKIKNWWVPSVNDQKGGLFYEAGVGYKIAVKNKMGFGLSAGYSYKEQSETVHYKPNCDFCVPIPQPTVESKPETFKYQFRRVSIKLHYWF